MPVPAPSQQQKRGGPHRVPRSATIRMPRQLRATVRDTVSASTPDAVTRVCRRRSRPVRGDRHRLARLARGGPKCPDTAAAARAGHRKALRLHLPWRGDQGAGAAEVVIAVPLLMLIILVIVQFAIWEHAVSVAQATAQEALAAARVQGGSAAAGQQRAGQVLGQIGSAVLVGPQIAVTRTDASVTVQVHATAERVIPLPGLSFPVTVTVTGPVERFIQETGGS